MSTLEASSIHAGIGAPHDTLTPSQSELWLATLLSIIAGMVDLIGFLGLHIFTAHITGNIVVIGALVARHDRVNPAQIMAIPVFMLAVAATWLTAKISGKRGPGLRRLLLLVQFLLIAGLLIFSVITKPSLHPHSAVATIAAMIAVSAMASQFTLLRLVLPVAPSTAVMTGNLTNAVLAFVDSRSQTHLMGNSDIKRLRGSLHLLVGFFAGCVLAAATVMFLGDWAWALPTVLAGAAVALS